MIKLINGFNEKCSNEEYHADREYKSSSALKMILKDPREYHRNYVLNEKQSMSKDALSIGSYAHCLVLEPHLEEVEFTIFNGKSRRGKEWEEFRDANEGKTIITGSQKRLVDGMMDEYKKSSVTLGCQGLEHDVKISSFFSGGEAEETLCGEINGYKVKTRFDYRKMTGDGKASINDLKTTAGAIASKADVEEICEYWRYDISAALYSDLATQATGIKHDFFFVFMSKKDNSCRIFKASEAFLERGRRDYLRAIELLKKAEKTGVYFETGIEELA